jgi:hypothetical protein
VINFSLPANVAPKGLFKAAESTAGAAGFAVVSSFAVAGFTFMPAFLSESWCCSAFSFAISASLGFH